MRLDEYQDEIVKSEKPHILVIAGSGSGKTRVITERLRWLVENGVEPSKIVMITFTNFAADEMRERLGAECEKCFVGTIHSYANRLLLTNGYDTSRLIEQEKFDDFFDMIKRHREVIPEVDYLLVDEYQDIDILQHQFFEMLKPKNTFLVGDDWQCQPKGTKILMKDKTCKNIEDLNIGDEVITYDLNTSRVLGGTRDNATNGIVANIAKRKIEENEKIIKVTTSNGLVTRYTPGHICLTNLCKTDEYNFLVYLMCDKNNRFRIGTSQLKNSNTNPWRAKMFHEDCDKIWVLQTFNTNKEARVWEDKLSYYYRIPQVTYQFDKTSYTEEDRDLIYEGLDTYSSAVECLKAFNRDIRYPFASRGDNIHYASNAFNKCYACNILPHNMKMKIYTTENRRKQESVDIINLEYETGYDEVYSLEIEKTHTYIADGIVTHNCIYEFKGSSPKFFFDRADDPKYTVYYLKNNYRSGRSIVSFATRILRNVDEKIEKIVSCKAPEGVVEETEEDLPYIIRQIEKNKEYGKWFILTWRNDDVLYASQELEKRGIPHDTFKKGTSSHNEIKEKMKENTVKVLTVHSAKGLENDYVGVFGVPFGRNDSSRRVAYVAATRAAKRLIWAYEVPKWKKKKDTFNWET